MVEDEKPKTIEIVDNPEQHGLPLLHVKYQGRVWKVLHARYASPNREGTPWVVLTQGPHLSRVFAKPDEIEPVFD